MGLRFLCLILLFVNFALTAAHAQAAAESVLNGHVGVAGVKAGTAMGNSVSKAMNGVAGQIQTVPQSNVATQRRARTIHSQRSTATRAATPAAPAPTGGSMITSIQGGHVTRSSTSSTTPQHD